MARTIFISPTFLPHKGKYLNYMPKRTFAISMSLPTKTRAVNTKEFMKDLVKIHITLVIYMNHMLTFPIGIQ